MGGGGEGGTISDSILGGTRHLFLVSLHNSENTAVFPRLFFSVPGDLVTSFPVLNNQSAHGRKYFYFRIPRVCC